jgi:hypothetical protein
LTIIRDFDSGSFQHLYNLSPSGYTVGDPSCASTEISTRFAPALGGDVLTSSPLITCGVRGSDSAFYVIRVGFPPVMQPNGTFDDVFTVVPFSPPGGILSDNAGCASTRLQVVTCGVRGSNGILHLIDFDTASGASTAYEDLNEAIVTAPTCVVFGAASERNVACAVVDLITNGLSSIASVRSPM